MPRPRLVIAAATLTLLLALAAPARAATTTFRVSPLGQWTSPASGNITGTATCDGGVGLLTFSTLTGTPYTVTGQTEVVCDGASHTWAATITGGPYTQGGAITFAARLVAPSGTVFQIPKVVLQ